MRQTDLGGRVVYGIGMKQLDGWDCGFESCSGHGCSSLVFIVCGVGSDLCEGRKPFRRSPTGCVCVIYKPQQWGGLGPTWVVAPQNIYIYIYIYIYGRCPVSTRQSSRHIEQTTDWTTEESWFRSKESSLLESVQSFPGSQPTSTQHIFCGLIPWRSSDS